ncbi:MAG: hypothetical protein HYU75_11145 [Betaproteobacteria bacterium]|nr:hypothetical protein [Betaproteobacteria bacterium]
MSDQGVGRPPDDRWKYAYELVAALPSEIMCPPDYRCLDGVVDFHMHVGFARIDPLAQLKLASRAGMRGMVFKISQFPTVELARTTNRAVREWADREGVRPAEAFGGLVLGPMVGGINLRLARRVIAIGGRVVWLPVLESAQHLEHARGLSREEARRQGTYVLADGRLIPEVVELVKIVADQDVALSLGHLGPEEMMAVAEEIDKVGFKKGFVDHPFDPPLQLSEQSVYDLVRAGLNLNWTMFELSQWCGIDPRAMEQVTRKVGADRVTLSSDAFFAAAPDSVEGMRLIVETFRSFGFSADEMRKMQGLNACRLLGVEPYPALGDCST